MNVSARQLTLDLYNCNAKKLNDIETIKSVLTEVIGSEPDLTASKISAEHLAIIGASLSGHIALHIYQNLKYVAADIFTCADNAEPEELSKTLRKFFQPDKMKSTFLKRGDFGQEKEIKPKIKTQVAPLRKVRNAGAKVVKNLVRRGDK